MNGWRSDSYFFKIMVIYVFRIFESDIFFQCKSDKIWNFLDERNSYILADFIAHSFWKTKRSIGARNILFQRESIESWIFPVKNSCLLLFSLLMDYCFVKTRIIWKKTWIVLNFLMSKNRVFWLIFFSKEGFIFWMQVG